MNSSAQILHDARCRAQLSVRGLASLAGVSASTISRVEAGTMDPTVNMLRRLLRATGQTLEMRTSQIRPARSTGEASLSMAQLAHAWTDTAVGSRPDWTRLRAFLDALSRQPAAIAAAIAHAPAPSGSPVMDALLAGIADKLADDAGLPRPTWSGSAPKLAEHWQTPGTPRMQQAARAATPSQLLERGLIVDAGSLWREPILLSA